MVASRAACAIGDGKSGAASQDGSSAETGAATSDLRSQLLAYRESNTTYWEIRADGKHVGYLLSYDALSEFNEVERHLPSGSHRIQDLGFSDLGYVTPTGEVLRHAAGGAQSLGSHPLNEGLRMFYGEPQDIELIRLRDAITRDEETEEGT